MAAAPKPPGGGGGKPPKDPPGDPSANEIAYTSSNSRGSIYTMTWEGATKTLIYQSEYATHPTWSADGSKLVFVEFNGPSGTGLYQIPSTGGSATLLTSTERSYINSDWSSSPTPNANEMIAFCDYDTSGDLNLFVINSDGTGKQALTSGGTYSHFEPTWSRLGNQIAVCKGDSNGQNTKLVIYDLAGDGNGGLYITSEADVTAIPGSPLNGADMIWSPAFARTSNDLLVFVVMNGVYDIWRIPDGDYENPVQLTDSANEGDYARDPAWKSDDSIFVYEAPKPKGNGETAWTRNAADGSNPTPIIPKGTASNYGTRP
jgi:Tol biopolymer transport system component